MTIKLTTKSDEIKTITYLYCLNLKGIHANKNEFNSEP